MSEGRGDDTDGAGTTGILAEKKREAPPAGNVPNTFIADRDTDGAGTGGIVRQDVATPEPSSGGSANPLSSGLQPGGITPGGGPGASPGSIGTGGGSNDNEATGDADTNNIDEEQQ